MAVRVRVSASGAIEVERDGRLLLQVATRDYESDLVLVASALRGLKMGDEEYQLAELITSVLCRLMGEDEDQLTERLSRSESERDDESR